MAVNTGDTISAAEYNTLQSRIDTIMGNGSAQDGYGQTVASSQVSVGTIVTAALMDNLRTDLNKANNHQLGSNALIGDIAAGQIIGADASGTGLGSLTQTDEGFNDYEVAVGVIETNKNLIDAGNSSVESTGNSSTRTTAWGGGGGGVITHTFTVSFNNADHRRHFFNAGGEIRFSANLSGQSGSKSNDWATMLSNMGTITFNRTDTTASGTGTAQAIGNFDLTGTYQQIFIKSGNGVYAENDYNIEARADSTSVINFKIEFRDDDTGDQTGVGPPVDENVNGTLVSQIQQLRATGSNVSVASPSYSNTSTL